jgi:SAM-dependent methyltransferase
MTEVSNSVYQKRVYDNPGFARLVEQVPPEQRLVLDVGCGVGANMVMLRDRGHDVTGVTLSASEAEICSRQGFRCEIADITGTLPFADQSFDALILSHVLEHVAYPNNVLRNLSRLLRSRGSVYVALPNVLFFPQRAEFLRGRFRYSETGLMDRTHLRFFDFHSARDLVQDAGFRVRKHFGVGKFPVGPLRRITPGLAERFDGFASARWPDLFAFHTVIVADL